MATISPKSPPVPSLSREALDVVFAKHPLAHGAANAFTATRAGGPVHVVYGGAHLFRSDTPAKLGGLALRVFDAHAGDAATFGAIVGAGEGTSSVDDLYARVRAKLAGQAVEAMTIDFEDGFGEREADEEDREAIRAAEELAKVVDGDRCRIGIRIKALAPRTLERGARTLDLFVTTFARATAGALRDGFTVTLPKVTTATEVHLLSELLTALETAHGLAPNRIGIELMLESPALLVDAHGTIPLAKVVAAGSGRVRAVHLGAYDLTAALGIFGAAQRLDHPVCDVARAIAKIALAGSDVAIVDGVTTTLPIPPRRDGGAAVDPVADRAAVHAGWSLHAANIRRALDTGIFQGWDVHPAQLPARYGAFYAYWRSQRRDVAARLATFLARATKASRVGQAFDDAATAQGLFAFFVRGHACGALDDADLAAASLTKHDLVLRSFEALLARRTRKTPDGGGVE